MIATEAAIRRAIAAVTATGQTIRAVDVRPDGSIRIETAETGASPTTPLAPARPPVVW